MNNPNIMNNLILFCVNVWTKKTLAIQSESSLHESNDYKTLCEQTLKPILVFIDEKKLGNEKNMYNECVLPIWHTSFNT